MKSVPRAVITHAHSDHARAGMKSYLTHTQSKEVLRLRLGKNQAIETIGYNEPVFMGPVKRDPNIIQITRNEYES
ncbi:MAG TPA: hypothetical protein PK509_04760, partial [Catalimonadaceae bacterium]|nr:hypothetical protein [Catalimonadaceae bacterium]